MASNFYSILTNVGKAKIANAHANRIPLELMEMAVGDGGGTSYNPSETMTMLKNETFRRELNTLSQDPNNESYLVAEMVIPADAGGFYVREAALFDTAGDMIAIGKIPETYKPVLDEGAAKDLYIKFIIEVSNAESVTLKINPSVVLATQAMAEKAADNAVANHEKRVNPHDQYLKKLDYTAADILTKLLTVDGDKSGLDADTIDGVELSALQPAGNYAEAIHQHDIDSISGILSINKGGTGNTVNMANSVAVGAQEDWKTSTKNIIKYEGADTVAFDLPYPHVIVQKYNHGNRGIAIATEWPRGGRRMWINRMHDIWEGWIEFPTVINNDVFTTGGMIIQVAVGHVQVYEGEARFTFKVGFPNKCSGVFMNQSNTGLNGNDYILRVKSYDQYGVNFIQKRIYGSAGDWTWGSSTFIAIGY